MEDPGKGQPHPRCRHLCWNKEYRHQWRGFSGWTLNLLKINYCFQRTCLLALFWGGKRSRAVPPARWPQCNLWWKRMCLIFLSINYDIFAIVYLCLSIKKEEKSFQFSMTGGLGQFAGETVSFLRFALRLDFTLKWFALTSFAFLSKFVGLFMRVHIAIFLRAVVFIWRVKPTGKRSQRLNFISDGFSYHSFGSVSST